MAVGIARIIAAIAQVFAEVFGIVAYEVLVPVVAVLQEAEERLTRTNADGPVITTRLQGVDCPMCEAGEPHRHTL